MAQKTMQLPLQAVVVGGLCMRAGRLDVSSPVCWWRSLGRSPWLERERSAVEPELLLGLVVVAVASLLERQRDAA